MDDHALDTNINRHQQGLRFPSPGCGTGLLDYRSSRHLLRFVRRDMLFLLFVRGLIPAHPGGPNSRVTEKKWNIAVTAAAAVKAKAPTTHRRRGRRGKSVYRGVCVTREGKWRAVIYKERKQVGGWMFAFLVLAQQRLLSLHRRLLYVDFFSFGNRDLG